MKRKSVFLIVPLLVLGLLFVVFGIKYVLDQRKEGESIIVGAFDSCGAAVVETNINAYAASTDGFLDSTEVERMVQIIADKMGMSIQQSELVENYSDDFNQLSVIGKDAYGHNIVIIVHSMDFTGIDDGMEEYETNIVVDVTLDGDLENLSQMEDRVREAIEQHMEDVRITWCIIGNYEENIPADRMEAIVYSIFQSVGAKEVERTVYDGLISISAYTPRIKEFVQVGDNRINLNVAMRYNSYENKTYIWLGSPVISVEY